MATISMKNLLESGVHFGHQTRRWDPRMAPYIFTARNGIHIIDLQQTVQLAKECYESLRDFVASGKKVLFVGTKKQARASVEREATRCGMYYVSNRWLGGLLTNFSTVKRSIDRLKFLEELEENDSWDDVVRTKREKLSLTRELEKLRKNLGGIKDMNRVPEGVVIIDPKREHIAVTEARKLGLTVFGVIDTNCNPELVDYPIPGNDDAIRAISLFLNILAEAVIEGTQSEEFQGVSGLSIVDEDEENEKKEAEGAEGGEETETEEAPATTETTEEAPAGTDSETSAG